MSATRTAYAGRAARRLLRCIAATLVCTGALVLAVGLTWYGTSAQGPAVHVASPNGATSWGSALTGDPGGSAW